MDINNALNSQATVVNPIGVSRSGDAGGDGKTVGSQDFMQLLTTQLRNQNPFEPVQDAEFLGQLAQFSSLEEAQSQRQAFDRLASVMTASAGLQSLAQASSLIGREVSYIDPNTGKEGRNTVDSVKFGDGGIQIQLKGGALVPLGNIIEIKSDGAATGSGAETDETTGEGSTSTGGGATGSTGGAGSSGGSGSTGGTGSTGNGGLAGILGTIGSSLSSSTRGRPSGAAGTITNVGGTNLG